MVDAAVDVFGGDMLGTGHTTLTSYLLTPDPNPKMSSFVRNLLLQFCNIGSQRLVLVFQVPDRRKHICLAYLRFFIVSEKVCGNAFQTHRFGNSECFRRRHTKNHDTQLDWRGGGILGPFPLFS